MDICIINRLLSCYDFLDHNKNLNYKDLVKKTTILFIIIDDGEKPTLFTVSVENILFKENKLFLLPNKTMKESNQIRPLSPLIYH